jgi:beta-ribofuranosylaminobenzene 5'-phosphate synthase
MTGMRIRVRTPSRLHFGLLGWGPQVRRQFGGVGLMIETPGIELIAEPATAWIAEGPLAVRVQPLLGQLRERIAQTGATLPPVRIRVVSAPPEHVGLGVGTQLCLAAARAVFKLAGVTEPAVDELARLTGRGHRSGIGLYGFQHGGLIIDGGRTRETGIPPLLARVPFPENWSILIVQPPGPSGLHGQAEVRAFADLPPIARDITDALCRLVLLEIYPAVIERDLQAFGAGLTELQARVGACFTPVQGGIYTTPLAAAIVKELVRLGFAGVGQSSWGPTLYAFAERDDSRIAASTDRLRRHFGLNESSLFWTQPANQGASIFVDD